MTDKPIDFVKTLETVLEARRSAAPEQSYTARLLGGGAERIAQKLGEEGVELALAGIGTDRERIVSEAADLVYHLLVLLHYHDLEFADVVGELERRQR